MTLLEKIIYLADYIEPTRDFCDLTELRRLAFTDLDQAMLLGFTMAVDDLQKKRDGGASRQCACEGLFERNHVMSRQKGKREAERETWHKGGDPFASDTPKRKKGKGLTAGSAR